MTKKLERPYLQLGRPRKYSKEEAKKKYALKEKQRVENFTDEEKELRKFTRREYTKKNKEKISANRKLRLLDPEKRKKIKEAQKEPRKEQKKKILL
ncbi:MAG: hypothetical protein H8E55_17205 [Pelagibacterales bacterium]|nr:hypothetical protein [Pelagibacterales bacterium]